jgi:hypothetical protein
VEYIAEVLQTLSAACFLWAAKWMHDSSRLMAVHGEKHKVTEHRLQKIETKLAI